MKLYRPEIDSKKWYKAFCFRPRRIGDYIVWLRWVEIQYSGGHMSPVIGVMKGREVKV